MTDQPTDASSMKEATQWSEIRWYVECPRCGELLGGEEHEFDKTTTCGVCDLTFKVRTQR